MRWDPMRTFKAETKRKLDAAKLERVQLLRQMIDLRHKLRNRQSEMDALNSYGREV